MHVLDSLSKYGSEFQYKVISILLYDPLFLKQSHGIIIPSFFDLEAYKWLVEIILDYYNKYKLPPTSDVLKIKIKAISNEAAQASVIDVLRNILEYNHTKKDELYIKDEFLNFCKNQKVKEAILESVDLLKNDNYDSIKFKIDAALKSGLEFNVGHNYKDDTNDRYAADLLKRIKTPWECVNNITKGGFAAGELIIVCAPPGIGKSTMLVNIGAYGICNNYNVLHCTLELNDRYVGRRYDSHICQIEDDDLDQQTDLIKSTIENKVNGNLIIKYWPTKSASVSTIRGYIYNVIETSFKPDMILIDYADLIKGNDSKDPNESIGNVIEELRGLAGEFNVPVFTCSQINREGYTNSVITGDKIAGTFSKLMTADFVMSLGRSVEDKENNIAYAHIIKSRLGKDGQTFPTKTDLDKCSLYLFDKGDPQFTSINNMQAIEANRNKLVNTFNKKFKL